MAMKDKDAAINSLRKALTAQPDFPEVQRALIALYVSDKKYPDALDIARTVQKQHPKKDVGYVLECDIHAAGGQWDAAAQALRTGLAQISTTTLAMKLHSVLQAADKETFEFYLGDKSLAKKDYASAERHYASVLKQQSNNPLALNNLAWVSAKLKRDGAIVYAERAVTLAPKEAMFMDTLATLRSEKGDYARALDLETRALALQPQNRVLMLNLAKIHLRAGKKELAKKSLDELMRVTHEDPLPSEVAALQKDVNALPDVTTAR
jgi:predicted Zn-dependent protease